MNGTPVATAPVDLGLEARPTRVDQARAVAKDLLPWGGLAAFLGSAIFGDLGPDLKKLLIEWGPGLVIFLVFVPMLGTYVRATERAAAALGMIARDIREIPRRDEFRFQDLMVGQDLILRELTDIKTRLPNR